jgi:adenylate kinase
MNIIVLGPPGSGKGTQAKLLAEKLNLRHISSGELLRARASQDTPDGKIISKLLSAGELVPFATIMRLVLDEIKKDTTGFILDGTPRNLVQAQGLDEFLETNHIKVDHVILYDLSDTTTTERLLNRAKLEGRSDDNIDTIKNRLLVYHNDTKPVIAHYQAQGKLLRVDASPSIEAIFEEVYSRINS